MAAEIGNKYAEGLTNSGRPTKYKEEYAELAYMRCLLGATDKDLAEFFKVNEDTIYEWRNVHEEFSDSISRGKEIADIKVANALYMGTQDRTVKEQQAFKIKVGQFEEEVEIVEVEKVIPADFRNQMFWLKNRSPKNWRDKQDVELSGDKENPVQVELSVDFKNLTDEQLRNIATGKV